MLRVSMRVRSDPDAIIDAIGSLVRENETLLTEWWNAAGGPPPRLDRAHVVYRRERRGSEDWQNAIELLERRVGDCEDLAAYHAAWLRVVLGEPAWVDIERTPSGNFHAIVRRGNGSRVDPSRYLVERERNARRMRMMPLIRLDHDGDRHLAEVVFPLASGGAVRAPQLGWTPVAALRGAIKIATRVLTDPDVAPLLPPGAAAAIRVADRLTRMNPRELRRAAEASANAAERELARGLLRAEPEIGVPGTGLRAWLCNRYCYPRGESADEVLRRQGIDPAEWRRKEEEWQRQLDEHKRRTAPPAEPAAEPAAAEPAAAEPAAVEGSWQLGPDGRHVWVEEAPEAPFWPPAPPWAPWAQPQPQPPPPPQPPPWWPWAQPQPQPQPPPFVPGYPGYPGYQWYDPRAAHLWNPNVAPPPGSAMAGEDVGCDLSDADAAALKMWGASAFDHQQ